MEKKIETGPYSEDSILLFEEGLIGFHDCKSFVFLGSEGIAPFRRLQSTDRSELSFMVLDPRFVLKDYLSFIPEREWEALGVEDPAAQMAVVICSIGPTPQTSTGNFQAPIIINYTKMIGRQVILSDAALSARQPLHNSVPAI
jgi:flagellar assembly factor FliW